LGGKSGSGGLTPHAIDRACTRKQILDHKKGMCSDAEESIPPLPSDTPDGQINTMADYLQSREATTDWPGVCGR